MQTASRSRSMDVKEYYDGYWSEDGFYPHGQLTEALRRLLEDNIPAGANCLDIGCGDGRSVGAWATSTGRQYLGVDISDNAVQDARAMGLDARQIDDVLALPFESESFDAVTFIEVLEHLFLPHLALEEAGRVLKPGGVLVATVPNVAYWRRRADMAVLGRWNPLGDKLAVEQPWRDPHIRFFNPGTLRRMVEMAGFTDVRTGGHDGAFVRDVPWVGRRLANGHSSGVYSFFERRVPALLADRLHVVARKPGAS